MLLSCYNGSALCVSNDGVLNSFMEIEHLPPSCKTYQRSIFRPRLRNPINLEVVGSKTLFLFVLPCSETAYGSFVVIDDFACMWCVWTAHIQSYQLTWEGGIHTPFDGLPCDVATGVFALGASAASIGELNSVVEREERMTPLKLEKLHTEACCISMQYAASRRNIFSSLPYGTLYWLGWGYERVGIWEEKGRRGLWTVHVRGWGRKGTLKIPLPPEVPQAVEGTKREWDNGCF